MFAENSRIYYGRKKSTDILGDMKTGPVINLIQEYKETGNTILTNK
jgi:hypothetical protein